MNTIKPQTKRSNTGAVLFPWEVLYQLGHIIFLGFVVTFGGTPSASDIARGREPNLKEHAGRQSIQFRNIWKSRHTAPVFAEPVPPEGN